MPKPSQPLRQLNTSPLDAIFGLQPPNLTSVSINLGEIHLPPQQPRRYFDPLKMQGLVESIKQHGILEPLLVRPLETGGYELVAGERRYKAAREAGLSEVPVTIRQLSYQESLQLTLIENLQREDLNPVEETEGVLQLLSLRLEMTVNEVISLLYRMLNEVRGKVGNQEGEEKIRHSLSPIDKSRSTEDSPNGPAEFSLPSRSDDYNNVIVETPKGQIIKSVFDSLALMSWESFTTNRLSLLKLPEDILDALRQGKITYTKAQAIARLKDGLQRQALLKEAIKDDLTLSQIRERIKALLTMPKPESPKARIESTYRQVTKSKVWENPKKWKQVEALLVKLEALVLED